MNPASLITVNGKSQKPLESATEPSVIKPAAQRFGGNLWRKFWVIGDDEVETGAASVFRAA